MAKINDRLVAIQVVAGIMSDILQFGIETLSDGNRPNGPRNSWLVFEIDELHEDFDSDNPWETITARWMGKPPADAMVFKSERFSAGMAHIDTILEAVANGDHLEVGGDCYPVRVNAIGTVAVGCQRFSPDIVNALEKWVTANDKKVAKDEDISTSISGRRFLLEKDEDETWVLRIGTDGVITRDEYFSIIDLRNKAMGKVEKVRKARKSSK